MCTSMAASPGLVGHEPYAYSKAASSCLFPPDENHEAANNNFAATTMSFLPPPQAMACNDCFPELCVPPPPDYYSPPHHVFAESDMNMRFVDGGRMMMTSTRTPGNGARRPPPASSRVGFRTRSEVDVLDDGFRWRKYGKKAVKSSPYLRNYYRCSAEGCGVKKRVERDPEDPRYVVTTYDGVHNHAAGGAGTGAAGHHHAPPPQGAVPYTAATTLAAAPPNVWRTMLLQAVTKAHSSESSY